MAIQVKFEESPDGAGHKEILIEFLEKGQVVTRAGGLGIAITFRDEEDFEALIEAASVYGGKG